MPMPAQIGAAGEWQLEATLNWGSSAQVQISDRETLIVDAETRELRAVIGRSLNDRWALQLQLPYRYTGAGNLDGFIDGWHDFFGLPEGARAYLPRDQVWIAYERDGSVVFDVDSSAQGIGDISAAAGYQWMATPRSSITSWLSIELPTGDPEKFTGNDATDIALTIAGEHRFDRWSAFAQLSVTHPGDGALLPDQQRSAVWSGLAGFGVNVWRGLELKLQLDAHSAVFDDTNVEYLGEAAVLTVGGAWKFQSGWQFDFGVSEDIKIDASPDVVFVFGVRRSR